MVGREIHSHWISSSGREGSSGDEAARFPYWSFTKTVIATCALKLAEAGRLDLDGPLDGRPYSLRQMLNHTSGLPDYGSFAAYHAAVAEGSAPWPREKLLEIALKDGMLFAPGEGWRYSNIGYMFAREKVEAAAGVSLAELASELVFAPLGLEGVELSASPEHFANVHWDMAGYDPRWVYHGCLIGSAAAAARILHGLFAGELLAPSSLEQMLERRPLGGPIEGRPWVQCGYGLGLMSGAFSGAGRAIGHSGAGPGSVCAVYHFPDRADPLTVACFTDGPDEGVAEHAAAAIARDL